MTRTSSRTAAFVAGTTLALALGACPKDAPIEPAKKDAGVAFVGPDGVVVTEEDRAKAQAALDKTLARGDCPEGTRRMGAEPPEGTEAWCERDVNGKPVKDGPYEAWHEGGLKAISGAYKDGERSGPWVQWHSNGQRKQEVTYVKGKPDGRFREWDEHGNTIADAMYKNGKVVK